MKWTWNKTNDDLWMNGQFDTREDAIQEARNEGITDFYIGQCELIPLRTDADIDRIMEELDELYGDESGCDDYIYDGVSVENRKWFEDKLSDLIADFHEKAKIEPGWYRVLSEEHIQLN